MIKWRLDMFTHITLKDLQSICHTFTSWKHYSKLLGQSKFLHITKLWPDQEEDLFSLVCILDQLTPFQDLVDGNIMIGWELWSGIMNSLLDFILVILKLDTSPISLVQSSQFSIMCTLDMNTLSSPTNGLILLRWFKINIWDTPKNNLSTTELTKNTNMSRRELSSTSLLTQNLVQKLTSITEPWICSTKSNNSNKPILKINSEKLPTDLSIPFWLE